LLPGHGAEHLVQACQRTQHKVRRKPIVITCIGILPCPDAPDECVLHDVPSFHNCPPNLRWVGAKRCFKEIGVRELNCFKNS
jgi:hypothetical protein